MANMSSKKTKKDPGPKWDPNSEAARKKGLQKGLAIIGGTVAAGTAAIASRFKKEERLERQGMRQESRATRKEGRATKITAKGGSTKKATKLTNKAKSLRTKSAANKKAAEIIYKSKNN
jgi:hypothetical protein